MSKINPFKKRDMVFLPGHDTLDEVSDVDGKLVGLNTYPGYEGCRDEDFENLRLAAPREIFIAGIKYAMDKVMEDFYCKKILPTEDNIIEMREDLINQAK